MACLNLLVSVDLDDVRKCGKSCAEDATPGDEMMGWHNSHAFGMHLTQPQ
jgi:hypothetical protein